MGDWWDRVRGSDFRDERTPVMGLNDFGDEVGDDVKFGTVDGAELNPRLSRHCYACSRPVARGDVVLISRIGVVVCHPCCVVNGLLS